MRVQTFVFIERLNRNSPPHAGTDNLPRQNARLRAYHRPALHTDVVAESDLTANHAVVFNRHAAADSGLRRDHHPLSNVAVMTDMNHIIEFRAASDSRSSQRAAIDAGVRAQLNIIFNDDRADLWKVVIAQVAAHVPEPIGADDYTGMQNDPVTNRHAVFEKNIRMNQAIASDPYIIPDFRAGANMCAGANDRILADADKSADEDFESNVGIHSDDDRRMSFRRPLLSRIQDFSDQSEG